MLSRRALSLLVLSVLLLATSAARAQPGAPGAPPPHEMEQLWFLRPPTTWHCAGTSFPPGRPGHAVEGEVAIRSDLGGFWRTARYEEKKTEANPMPLVVQEYYTYDASKKAFLWVAFDSLGGWMQGYAPAGGESYVFTGEARAGGAPAAARISFTRRAASEMTVLLELGMPDWAKLVDLVCKQ